MTVPSSDGGHQPPGAVGRIVAVTTLLAALRRRWRLWLSGAGLGILVAVAFSLAAPPPHTASTVLLLQHPSETDGARAMLTDARLVESRAVAQAAIESLGRAMTARQLTDQYEATVLSDVLLQIKVEGPSDGEAVRRAEAVATAFLAFRSAEIERQSAVALKNLEERQRALTTEVLEVTDQVNARTGPQGPEALRALGDLLVRRATVNETLGSVRQRIEVATFDTDSVIEKTRVVDPAGEEERSPVKVAGFNMVAGLVLGLLLSTGWIVVQEATSDHQRRRDDVAAALGAPVAVSVDPLRGPRWARRRCFRKRLATPPPDVVRAVKHIREALEEIGGGKRALVFVSVKSDDAAALVLAATTLGLMHDETSVLVVDLTRRSTLARLTKVRPDEPDWLPSVGSESALWVSFPSTQMPDLDEAGPAELADQVDVVLTLATIDPAVGAGHLIEVADSAIVVATAGRSSETTLGSVAQMIEAAGLRLHSTVLVGADGGDDSVGLLGLRATRQAAIVPRGDARP